MRYFQLFKIAIEHTLSTDLLIAFEQTFHFPYQGIHLEEGPLFWLLLLNYEIKKNKP